MAQPRPSHRSVLDALLRPAEVTPPAQPLSASAQEAPPAPVAPAFARGKRRRLTVSVDPETLEKARVVVYYSPGLTLVDLITDALRAEIVRRESERGAPFPVSRGQIRTGKPIR